MFTFAILIGIYSYIIFALGVLGILYKNTVLISTLVFIFVSFLYFKSRPKDFPKIDLKNKKIRPYIILFSIMAFINLIGALGPELSFDALWYHLTIPKIFIQNHAVFYIPGGLFYYSLMPKLGEMLFILDLMFGNEIVAKLTQWVFGVLTSIAIYKVSRKLFDEKISIIASAIFYSSLVVSWQSTVAYIDLTRTFFETMGLWCFLEFYKSKNKKWLVESAVMVGLAISTKLIALGTIPIFITLLLIFDKNWKKAIGNSLIFVAVSILVPFPWFFFSFLNTGNLIYPVFSEFYKTGLSLATLLNPLNAVKDLFILFFKAADPISPIYIIFLPLVFIYFKKFGKELKIISIYSLLALIIWYLTPRSGGGRFILPYLPAFSILAAWVIANTKIVWLRKYLTGLVIVVSLITILYRGIANSKFIPVIFGMESKQNFLTKNLNFDFGDFYDTDGFFKQNIKSTDRVLLFGFHNLYYANFPFIHESYVKEGGRFNYIATKNAKLPERFLHWNLIYKNDLTGVKVYSMRGMQWYY